MLFYMICCEAFVTDAACASSDRSFLLELFGNVVSSAFVFISVIPFEVCLQRLRLGALVSEVAESSGAQFEGILPIVIRSKILGVIILECCHRH